MRPLLILLLAVVCAQAADPVPAGTRRLGIDVGTTESGDYDADATSAPAQVSIVIGAPAGTGGTTGGGSSGGGGGCGAGLAGVLLVLSALGSRRRH